MDNRNQSRGGRIGGRLFPRLALVTGAPFLLWVLATYGAFKPQTVTIHNHAPAVPSAPFVQLPEIKIPPPQIFIRNGDPETMEVVAKELQLRQQMVQRVQTEIRDEVSGLVRQTRKAQPSGVVRTTFETPALYYSDCEDNPQFKYQRADGTWQDGMPFASGN